MKVLLIAAAIATTCVTAVKAQTSGPQEPTTFVKYDTVKIVLQVFDDSTTLAVKQLKAFKVCEVRKGDQTAQYYALPKKYLSEDKKEMQTAKIAVFYETVFPWKRE